MLEFRKYSSGSYLDELKNFCDILFSALMELCASFLRRK